VFTFFDHTGDVGVELRCGSLPALFADAARALAATLTDAADVRPARDNGHRLDAGCGSDSFDYRAKRPACPFMTPMERKWMLLGGRGQEAMTARPRWRDARRIRAASAGVLLASGFRLMAP
jgi:hypothetical protein